MHSKKMTKLGKMKKSLEIKKKIEKNHRDSKKS